MGYHQQGTKTFLTKKEMKIKISFFEKASFECQKIIYVGSCDLDVFTGV